MIYIQNITTIQTLTLPVVRVYDLNAIGQCTFSLFSSVDRANEYTRQLSLGDFNNDFSADFAIKAEPILTRSGQHYKFDVMLDNVLAVGEYQYLLAGANGAILGRGIAIVGNYHQTRTEYGNTKEYKQYGA